MNVLTPPDVPELSPARAARLRHHLLDEIERPHARPAAGRAAIWAPVAAAVAVLVVVAGITLRPASWPIDPAAKERAAVTRLLNRAADVAARAPWDIYTEGKIVVPSMNGQTPFIEFAQYIGGDIRTQDDLDARGMSQDGVFASYKQGPNWAVSVPTDPAQVLALARDKRYQPQPPVAGLSPDGLAFATLGFEVRFMVFSPKQNAAVLRAAALVPGVKTLPDGADVLGRHGVAIARDENGVRFEWIFDAKTYAFLGERVYLLQDTAAGKKGDMLAGIAWLKQFPG